MANKINRSGAKYSSIVSIGEKLKQKSESEGREYLYLNRGINQVVTIELNKLVKSMDFNTPAMQYYPPGRGSENLKAAINEHFFTQKADTAHIFITAGGMHGLHLTMSCLDYDTVYTPNLFWGAYANLMKIHHKKQAFYHSTDELIKQPERFADCAVIICDPNNPSGEKIPDERLLQAVKALHAHNAAVIWDGPYRKLFTDENDKLYEKLLKYENVIISESFSKSVGLSGQRVGFIHSRDAAFRDEFAIRLLFSGNGVNVFAQELIAQLLASDEGKQAVKAFRQHTSEAIEKNIQYLKSKELIAKELYSNDDLWGIFVIVNKTQAELEDAAIGSVGLNYFTKDSDIQTENYSRICVSVPHEKFVNFFEKL